MALNRIKLYANGETISRLAKLQSGQEIRISKYKNKNRWRWCTYINGKSVSIYGDLKRNKFLVTDPRYVEHAKTYRRGQPVSEGMMVEIAAEKL